MALTGGDVVLERGHDGRVAYLTLSHGTYTVVTMEMRRLVAERFAEIDRDPQIKVVVVRSDGQHFTSGGDIAGFMEVDPIDLTDLGHDVTAPARSAKPVIAAIDGYCFGVGLEMALACDIRLGTGRTRGRGPGHEPRALPSAFTTPEAPDLQALFAVMVEAGVTDVAMEVSSHALALGRVGGTRFSAGAFTNLSQDHLDFHPTMADYFEAKARLLVGGGAGVEPARHGVVCIDDEWGRRLAARRPEAVTVSAADDGPHATWTVRDLAAHPDGTQTFTAIGPGGLAQPVTLALPGRYNVANALVALACLDADGIPPQVTAEGFAQLSVPGRMQRVDAGQPWLAVVDYAHKPAAVAALLDALRAQIKPHARVLTVLGCGGDRDTGKRPLMGAAAAIRSDLLVITDDNPRSEDPAAIRRAMLDGAAHEPARGDVIEIGDRRSAIVYAVRSARPGDAVVIAGKGHETGQEVHGVKYPFDDADELVAAIRAAS